MKSDFNLMQNVKIGLLIVGIVLVLLLGFSVNSALREMALLLKVIAGK